MTSHRLAIHIERATGHAIAECTCRWTSRVHRTRAGARAMATCHRVFTAAAGGAA